MNIYKIRNNILLNKGKCLKFRFNGNRNQVEEFQGFIENVYSSVFTIRLNDNNYKIKSFTYSDILTNSLQIYTD